MANCSNADCEKDNLTDFPLCPSCAATRHFTHRQDCRCVACAEKRAAAFRVEYAQLAEIAHTEELQYTCGRSFAAA